MGAQSRYLLPFLFFLIPLSYSIDNDPYRTWEVLFWGGFTMLLSFSSSARFRTEPKLIVIFAYAAVLIFQQFLIPDGRPWFGAQYALVFAAAMLPSIVLRWLSWSMDDFNRYWHAAIRGLSLVILVNVGGGFLLGWGELYLGGQSGGRYFGYLGDAISPVIVFPLIYFFLERRYGWMALMLGALMLTGGKTAMLLLVAAPFLMVVVRMRPLMQFLAICAVLAFVLISESLLNELVLAVWNDPHTSYSINTRQLSNEAGWDYFKSSPIWGIGINQSIIYVTPDADALARYNVITAYWPVYQIHNAFIRALAETGVIGLGVLVGLCVLLIRRSLSALRIASDSAPSRCRSIVISGGIWTVLFISVYQSTGWFEHGHPQFAWLLVIEPLTGVGARLLVPARRSPVSLAAAYRGRRVAPARRPAPASGFALHATDAAMRRHRDARPTNREPDGETPERAP